MVGVPGRSKGCNTCRQRRIACGLERPQCAQCIKSNRWCSGYQRDRIFVHGRAPGQAFSSDSSKSASDAVSRITNGALGDRKVVQFPKPALGFFASRTKPELRRCLFGDGNLSAVAYRRQFVNAFVKLHMPSRDVQHSEEWSWVEDLPNFVESSTALETATLALSTARVGRANDNKVLTEEGLKLYGKGLKELQKALWDPRAMYKDETLAACLMLIMYEIFECPSGSSTGYITHQNGCAKLVQLRGPEAHASGLAFHVFRAFRSQAVLEALRDHKATYLADPIWIETPWKYHPKSSFDEVVDYLSRAPWFWEQADKLNQIKSPPEILHGVLTILDHCYKMDAEMRVWYDNLKATSIGALYWPELSNFDNPMDNEETGRLFPVSFHFVDLKTARTLVYYWATLVMLSNGTRLLRGTLPNIPIDPAAPMPCSGDCDCFVICSCKVAETQATEFDFGLLPVVEDPLDTLSLSRNVLQSVEYCLQDEMQDFGPAIISAPLNIVIDTLKHIPEYQREYKWAKGAYAALKKSSVRILEHVEN